jgi:hypothetical protein
MRKRAPIRERARRFLMAAAVGAAVVVTPGSPTPGRGPGWQPPAFERALRWRDIIRMRLGPWLLGGGRDLPVTSADPPTLPSVRRDDARRPVV